MHLSYMIKYCILCIINIINSTKTTRQGAESLLPWALLDKDGPTCECCATLHWYWIAHGSSSIYVGQFFDDRGEVMDWWYYNCYCIAVNAFGPYSLLEKVVYYKLTIIYNNVMEVLLKFLVHLSINEDCWWSYFLQVSTMDCLDILEVEQ